MTGSGSTTLFWFLAALATVAALLPVALPLLRRPPVLPADQAQRLAVYRDRRQELQRDREAGRITEADAQAALDRLAADLSETMALDERAAAAAGRPAGSSATASSATSPSATTSSASAATAFTAPDARHRLLALLLMVTIPIGALGLYNAIGMPQIIDIDPRIARGETTPEQLDEAIATLRKRIDGNDKDLEALVLLAQAYRAKQDLASALPVYERIEKLLPPELPGSARLLADYAETLVVHRNGNFDGQPLALLERALKINPDDQKALGLYGAGLYRTGKAAQALVPLRKLQQSLPAGEQQQAIGSLIQRIDGELAPAATASATDGVLISGSVRVADTLRDKYDRNATLFIVAREAGGPPMPIAVLRLSGGTMPQDFALGDRNAMTPDRKLSAMSAVTIEARLSASGNAIRQPGDLIGSVTPIKPGQRDLQIVIDRTVP